MAEEKYVSDDMCKERSGNIEQSLKSLHRKFDRLDDTLHKVDRHSVWISVLLGAGSIIILVMVRLVWIVIDLGE